MKKLDKRIWTVFGFAIALSVGFPLGVLGIIFGATKGLTVLLVFGIIFTVIGFYVMPILWVKFGEMRQDRSVLFMIEHEQILTVSGLAAQTGYTEDVVRAKVKKLILSHALVGYLLKDDILERNVVEKPVDNLKRSIKCDNCGAMMILDGKNYKCEYCGNIMIG